MKIPPELTDITYIGDGVYAAFDGYQIWAFADRDGFEHSIALEPNVLDALERYWQKLKNKYEDRRP